ncbi:MAG: hypothetical protein H7838_10465, partial [Magnetococcus sp. DMHC-8]
PAVSPAANLFRDDVAARPEDERLRDADLQPTMGDGLIVVAEFARQTADEVVMAPLRPLVRVARGPYRPPPRWAPLPDAPDGDGFFSGVVAVLPGAAAVREAVESGGVRPGLSRSVFPPRDPVKGAGSAGRPGQAVALVGGRGVLPPAALEFKTRSGFNFRGVARDVSLNGVLAGSMALGALQERDTGRLRLVSDVGVHQFPCEVLEVSESPHERQITLRLFANGHQFESVTKEKIFKEVWRDHQALAQRDPGGPHEADEVEPLTVPQPLARRWKN